MTDIPHEPISDTELVIEQRLVACGLDRVGLTVKYDDDLQSIEIVIGPKAGATADDFACIREAAGYEVIRFEDLEMFAAYTDFVSELTRPEMMVKFEGKLREVGLWEDFPSREDFSSLAEYAEALEEHAGFRPGSVLRVSGEGLVLEPSAADLDDADFVARYSELIVVVSYASIRDWLDFGFIGNEKRED